MKENKDDIFLWEDGQWCFRFDYIELYRTSSDFAILHFDSKEYQDLLQEYEG